MFNLLQILIMNSLNVKHQEKKVQSIGISPVSLQVFMKTLRNDISEAYKVQADCLKIMIKWFERESAWFGSLPQGSARKIKNSIIFRTNSNSYLVPDKWSRMYCSEYFNVFEYLVWTSHEIKKVGEILAKPVPEKIKSYHHWNTSSSNKRLWRWQFQ